MHGINCPHCGKAFKIDEAGYADIIKQVRDSEFEKQLHDRLDLAEREKRNAVELAKAQLFNDLQKAQSDKDAVIQGLKAKLDNLQLSQQLAVNQAVSAIEKERDEVKSTLQLSRMEKQLAETALKEKYETQIKDRDDAIERLRDMKARLSTKMVGETLEQHCETEFNRIRSMAFPNAYFEKDNDVKGGSKGDYIFKDEDESGTEIVSIMFEMKNESDETRTSSRSSTRTAMRRAASMRSWFPCLSPTASYTTRGLSTFFTATQRCMSSDHSFLFRSSRCSVTRQ